jgi:hypothetical protein
MPDSASVAKGPKLGRLIYADAGANFLNAFREMLRAFDQLTQSAVISRTLSAPPGSPANGDAYIVGASPTGAWAGKAANIAVWTTQKPTDDTNTLVAQWEFYPPKVGMCVWVAGDSDFMIYNGTAWTFDNNHAGILQFQQATTGAASAALGANSPATVATAPYTWIQAKAPDGTTVYIPAWK